MSKQLRGAQHTKPFFGLDVPGGSQSAFDSVAAKIGVAPTVSSIFVKLDSASVQRTLDLIPAAVTPFVTLEPWAVSSQWGDDAQPQYSLRSIIESKHDAALLRLAHQFADADRPLYLRFAHEMNGSWYPWAEAVNGNKAGDFRTAWRHVHDLMQPILGKLVKWVWAPNILNGAGAAAPTFDRLYPGDDYVDFVGMTGYSHGDSVRATYCPTMRALRRVSSHPVILSEIGYDGADKAVWLRQLGAFVKANPRIAGIVYYNTSLQTTGASGDYRIDSQRSTLVAMGAAMTKLGTTAASTTGMNCG